MPRQRLADLRTTVTSMDEAHAALREAAILQRAINLVDARAKKRTTEIQAKADADAAPLREQLDTYMQALRAYIVANPGAFEKPRAQRTEFGSFGLRKSTEVAVLDLDTAVAHCLSKKALSDCVITAHKLVKPGIRRHLEAGDNIPGVALNTGDVAFADVAKDFAAPPEDLA